MDLLIYGGIPFTNYKGQLKENEQEFFQDLDYIASSKKDEFLHWIEDWRNDIRSFTQIREIVNRTSILTGEFTNLLLDGSVSELLGPINRDYTYTMLMEAIVTLQNSSDWYSSILIADPNSGHIIITTDINMHQQNIFDRNYFQNTLITESTYITECKYGVDKGNNHVHIGRVIKNDNNSVVGIMVLTIEYKSIGERLTGNLNVNTQRIETKLINKDSILLLPLKYPLSDGSDAEVFKYKLKTHPALLSIEGQDGFIESIDYKGVYALSAYRSIVINTDFRLGLILSRDSEELYSLVKKQVITAIIISGFIILFIIFIVILVSRGITKPIKNLMKVSEQIMLGNFNYRTEVVNNDEIGKLAISINHMTDALEKSRRDLEQKVQERTKSLAEEIKTRKQTEESMRKLSYAVEQSPTIVIILDTDFNIEYVNPTFTRVSGYSAEEVIGKNPIILNKGNFSRDKQNEMIAEVLNDTIKRTEFNNIKKNGEEYWVSVSISGIKDKHGVFTNILEVQEDITEERKLKEQLFQAQKLEAIGTLAGGVAHDFNNILSIILGYSDYLISKLDKDDKIYSIMEDIREAGNRGASLTSQLLAFGRKQNIQIKLLNLNDVIRRIEKMLKRLLSENVNMSLNLEEHLWTIEADPGYMDQILMNLAVNSSHAMPDGGLLTISSRNINLEISNSEFSSQSRSGKFVSLSIKDTGCGMNELTISRIFDPFFTTKPIGKGTGLGLSVVYGIVEQHRGWIDVESKPDKGTEFVIFLPATEKQEKIQTKVEVQTLEWMGKGEKILLVEDDKVLRNFAAKVLTENGYNVFSAESVNEVFDMFDVESGVFNIIFSDVMLPDINGVKLVEFLLERNAELKILLTSGYTDERSNWKEIQEKGYKFLQKPYTMDSLLKKIAEVLRN
ncbi:MAG: PAS domain S-box protein [Spirochaetales bacterium]|nr:PAS domain S-box protein [Spirochaetales bacterium]